MFKGIVTGFLAFWGIFSGCPYSDRNCSDCHSFKYKIENIGRIPGSIKESSGLVMINDLFLTHGDSGNEPVLYGFKYPFNTDSVQGILPIEGTINTDWEDLASDKDSLLFIGDFGNNGNKRTDLNIIKYDINKNKSELIRFEYEDQEQFPPPAHKDQIFDCEAMFWHNGQFYIFSKNKKSKYVKVYRLKDYKSPQQISPADSIRLRNTQVTSADISPDNNEVALLAYGKVLFFSVKEDESGNLILLPKSCKRIVKSGQAEAIIYIDNENLLITNEKGKIFLISRKYKGSKSDRPENPGFPISGFQKILKTQPILTHENNSPKRPAIPDRTK